MLRLCLNFKELYPKYAYKRYAYKNQVYLFRSELNTTSLQDGEPMLENHFLDLVSLLDGVGFDEGQRLLHVNV